MIKSKRPRIYVILFEWVDTGICRKQIFDWADRRVITALSTCKAPSMRKELGECKRTLESKIKLLLTYLRWNVYNPTVLQIQKLLLVSEKRYNKVNQYYIGRRANNDLRLKESLFNWCNRNTYAWQHFINCERRLYILELLTHLPLIDP